MLLLTYDHGYHALSRTTIDRVWKDREERGVVKGGKRKNRKTRESWFAVRFTASGHEVTIQIAILFLALETSPADNNIGHSAPEIIYCYNRIL